MRMSSRPLSTVLLAALLALTPVAARAQVFSGSFGGPGYSAFNRSTGFGNSHIWHQGDFWQQIVASTGLQSVDKLDLSLSFGNVLSNSNSQTFDVLLNAITVGSFSVGVGQFSSQSSFSFSSVGGVNGSDYTIKILQTSLDVPTGRGSTNIINGQTSSDYTMTQTVPEPSTVALLGAGLALMLGVATRRRPGQRQ